MYYIGPDLTQLELMDEMSTAMTRNQALQLVSLWKGTNPKDLFYKELETATGYVVDFGELIYKITIETSLLEAMTWRIEKYV